ncbi:hypothetical protein X777_10441 [Ooceraea biroi]|uniref:Uncharacterized protein n=1 Tax=Ooceraea biroi TaxID=2015173 RepID=A0A026W4Y3_OOCBI|nr:hypothetical protein X777_10441 [Ooceraea biroi]
MPTAGPFKGILAKGAGDLVDPATGFTSAFVADPFLVFGLAKWQRKSAGSQVVHRWCNRCGILEFFTKLFIFRIDRRSWFLRNTTGGIKFREKYCNPCFSELQLCPRIS